MDNNFGIGFFNSDPVKAVRRGWIRFFGTKLNKGDKSIFDSRGAITIRAGEKSISDSGNGYMGSDPMVIPSPSGGKGVSAQKAMASNYGWVYACVKAISDEMAGIDFRLFKINSNGDHAEELEHEVLDLLDGVNERQTGPEFKKTIAAHMELTGNAYIYLLGKSGGVKDYDEKPTAMYLLNPGQTRTLIDRSIFPYQVKEYVMKDDDRIFRFQPWQIVHLKYPDPNNPFEGMGTVDGIAEWIDNDNYAMEYNRNFFKNGARLSGVFETEFATVDQAMRLKISFDEQFAGVKNAYKTMIMPKGVKFTPTQASVKDMDMKNLLEMTGERIRAGFRVSNTILGTAESDTNRATAETADYVFAKRTIKPKMEMIISYLNEFLVPRYGDNLYLSFNDPVPEDKQFRTEEMKTAVAGKQVITQNEAREEFMGLGPVEDPSADELTTGAPAPDDSEDGDEGGDDDTSKSKKKKKSIKRAKRLAPKVNQFVRYSLKGKRRKVKTQFSRNKEVRKEMAASLAALVKDFMTKAKSKSVVDMTDDEYIAAIYTHQKSRMDEFEPKLKEILSKINRDQEKEVKANLSKAIKTYVLLPNQKDINPAKLFDMKKWINITVDALTPLMDAFFGKEAESALLNIGAKPADIFASTSVRTALDTRISLLADSYNSTILNALTEKLNDGLNAGASLAQLTTTVGDVYDWSDTYQAARIAKTETVAVSNMANKAAWKEAGTVKTVKWYTSEKDNVCTYCQAQNGKEIDIDDNYFDKGDTITGSDGAKMTADYSDIGGPPLHPNCGCFIRPASFNPINSN